MWTVNYKINGETYTSSLRFASWEEANAWAFVLTQHEHIHAGYIYDAMAVIADE